MNDLMAAGTVPPSQPGPDRSFGLLRLPNQVAFGFGAIRSLAETAQQLGRRAFICCDPYLEPSPAFAAAMVQLTAAGLTSQVLTKIIPELPVASVEAAADAARGYRPDLIIGFGGGSSLDLAKLVALLLQHDGPLSRYYGENAVPGPVLPMIAVPTTAGTGSEVTPVAVVSDPERELKVGISSPELIPRYAIVDPALTVGAPPALTAYAGIDALVHAIEALTSRAEPAAWDSRLPVFVGRNRLSSLLAGESARLVLGNLERAVAEPNDLGARELMSYGSLLAGMAFGTAGTHLSHAIQYPVGALTKTPHGLGTGLLLPYVLRGCLPEIAPELITLAASLGLGDQVEPEQVITMIEDLKAAIGIPATLADIGITADQLPQITDLARTITRLANNAVVGPERIGDIVRNAWSGEQVPARIETGRKASDPESS